MYKAAVKGGLYGEKAVESVPKEPRCWAYVDKGLESAVVNMFKEMNSRQV